MDEFNQESMGFVKKCQNWCGSFPGDSKRVWGIIVVILAAAVLWKVLAGFGLLPAGDFPVVATSKWQAVFLSNNQVYFGHLENYNREYARLKDIYYLQVSQPLQQGGQQATNVNLVKLGQELHGPEDAMFIPKDKILFWENLKNDAQVVRAILSTRQ